MGRSPEPSCRPSKQASVKFSAIATAIWRLQCSAASRAWSFIRGGWTEHESHFCRWVTKLPPCESSRGHKSRVSTATYTDGYSPSSSCSSWGRKLRQVLDLAAIATNILTPSFWLQCFTSLVIGQEITLLSDPLSLIQSKSFCCNTALILERIAEKPQVPKE